MLVSKYSRRLSVALGGAKDRLASELLADSVELVGVAPAQGSGFRDWEIEGMRLSARVRRVGA